MNDVCETTKPINIELKKNNQTLGTMILLPTTVGIISIDNNYVELNVPDLPDTINIYTKLNEFKQAINERI